MISSETRARCKSVKDENAPKDSALRRRFAAHSFSRRIGPKDYVLACAFFR